LFPSSAFSDNFTNSGINITQTAYAAESSISEGVQDDSPVTRDQLTTDNFNKLKTKAEKDDTVPVIVGLSTSFELEGTLDYSNVQAQIGKIKQDQDSLLNYLSSSEADKIHKFEHVPFIAMTVDKNTLESLEASPLVTTIFEDVPHFPTLDDSVPLIGAPQAWSSGYSGQGQAVAILDTGVDNTHSAFSPGRIIEEACYGTDVLATSASICNGGALELIGPDSALPCIGIVGCEHGTHVAGIAAGNDATITGVAKDSDIIAIKVFSKFFSTTICGPVSPCIAAWTSDIIEGLDRVATLASPPHNIDISSVNLSLGSGGFSSAASCDAANPSTKTAVDNLRSMGIATIASSGNGGFTSLIGAPACISSVVSVGSTTKSDVVSGFSNSANYLDLLAPGQSIFSSIPGGYAFGIGTSMSTAHVTGSWAVLKSGVPGASVDDVLNSLKDTGVPITDTRNGLTFPRIQVDDALNDLGIVPSTGIHDMRVDAFSVIPLVVTQGDIINLQATITNVGTFDEGNVRISYRDTLTQTGIANQFNIAVDAGETVVGNVMQWDTTGAILGDHVLRAKVELDNGLVDENPSDNEIFVTVTVQSPSGPPLHDMRVDAFSVIPLVVTQGDIINLQATITNVGNVDEVKVRISYRDTLTSSGIANQFNIAVDAGDTVVGNVIQWDTTGAILGDHVLRAKVQLDNGLVDENPSDNEIFVTVTVESPSGPPPTDIHDMRVDTFSVPLVVTQGDIVNLQATITNVGNVDEVKVKISYRDTLTSSGIANQFNIPVAVGDTVVGNVMQWDTTGAIIGDHVLRAKVQLDNGLVDENPSDNNIYVTVTVESPSGPLLHDMRVDTFSVPLVVTQGDIVNLQATITNVGNVDEVKVKISYRDTLTATGIANQFNIPVAVGETVVGNVMQWDTTGAILGDHVLRAKVQLNGFVDENPSDNNIFVTVTVIAPP